MIVFLCCCIRRRASFWGVGLSARLRTLDQTLGGEQYWAVRRRSINKNRYAIAPRNAFFRRDMVQRTCPVPTISYFEEVSSASAKGPRQCNFWVLMPISAPKPNSAPSVNRVEAFQYTAAESTPARNLRPLVSSRVMIASECFVE